MVEYVLILSAAAGFAWLYSRLLALKKEVAALESLIGEQQGADARVLREEVSSMVDELKSAADTACTRVTNKIAEIEDWQSEKACAAGSLAATPQRERTVASRGGSKASRGAKSKSDPSPTVPIDLIVQLADEGLSVLEIARQAKVGVAEVELTLKYRCNRGRYDDAERRRSDYVGKEVGSA